MAHNLLLTGKNVLLIFFIQLFVFVCRSLPNKVRSGKGVGQIVQFELDFYGNESDKNSNLLKIEFKKKSILNGKARVPVFSTVQMCNQDFLK